MSLADLFRKKSSGNIAKDRLKLVLVSDRANCSPEIMEKIKNDIIQVISKYVEIDLEGLDIKITQTESDGNNGTVPALFANIPIKEVKNKNYLLGRYMFIFKLYDFKKYDVILLASVLILSALGAFCIYNSDG
ncbi:MAG: cell division topological specificity factor MinE, partial [Lachnospiraceae bacterium]|nr:cell division topological specificity factor MinE [Lachnospiraceae bacterium]